MGKIDDYIFCIVGKSGSGKTTIVEKLHELYNFEILSSYTTRPPRYPGETGHKFIDLQTYLILPNKVAFVEFDGNHYCATKSQADDADLYVIDPDGLKQFRSLYHGKKQIVTVYLDVSMDECLRRMRKRGDSEDSCWNRLRNDEAIFRDFEADYVIDGHSADSWWELVNIIDEHIKRKGVSNEGN